MPFLRIAGGVLLSVSMTLYSSGCVDKSTESLEMECCKTNLCPMHSSQGKGHEGHDCCKKLEASQALVGALAAKTRLTTPDLHGFSFAPAVTARNADVFVADAGCAIDRPPPLGSSPTQLNSPLRV